MPGKLRRHHEDPDIVPTVVVSAVFAVLVAITIVGLEAYFGRSAKRVFDERVEARPFSERDRIRTEQRERMSSYAWVDDGAGSVAIPIDRAMELVVSELGADRGSE